MWKQNRSYVLVQPVASLTTMRVYVYERRLFIVTELIINFTFAPNIYRIQFPLL